MSSLVGHSSYSPESMICLVINTYLKGLLIGFTSDASPFVTGLKHMGCNDIPRNFPHKLN